MMDFISQHKIASLVVLLILIGAAWWGFTSNSSPSATLVTTAGPADASSTQDAQLVATLLQLQAVTLSGTILNDPGFLALQDFTTQVVTEPVGRPNPFAPLSPGVTSSASSSATLNPNLFAPAKH
jgi:hypothetical protein